jgi:hypothetical protein
MHALRSVSDLHAKVDQLDGAPDGQLTLKEQKKFAQEFFEDLTEINDIFNQNLIPQDLKQKIEEELISEVNEIGFTKETVDLAQLAIIDVQLNNFLERYKQSLSHEILPQTIKDISDLHIINHRNELISGQDALDFVQIKDFSTFKEYSKLTLHHSDCYYLHEAVISNFSFSFPDPDFIPPVSKIPNKQQTNTNKSKTGTINSSKKQEIQPSTNTKNDIKIGELKTITIEGQSITVKPYTLPGQTGISFFKSVPKKGEKAINYEPNPPNQIVRVKALPNGHNNKKDYIWTYPADQNSFWSSLPVGDKKPTRGYILKEDRFIPVQVIRQKNKTIYKSKSGLKYDSHGERITGWSEGFYGKVGMQSSLISAPTQQSVPTEEITETSDKLTATPATYQATTGYQYKKTGTNLNLVSNISLPDKNNADEPFMSPDKLVIQQNIGFNTKQLSKKQIKVFDRLGVDIEKLKKMSLQEVQLTALAWYQFGEVNEKLLGNIGLNFNFEAKSIYGFDINMGAKIDWQKIKKLQVLPSATLGDKYLSWLDASIDHKYFEAIASGRYQAAYLKLPVKNTDWTIRLGAGALNGNVGATIGADVKSENAEIKGGEIGINAEGMPRFIWRQGLSMHGNNIDTFVLDCTSGFHQYQKNIPGTGDVMDGEVVAYQHAKTKNGVKYLFQHLEKNAEATALIGQVVREMQTLSTTIGQSDDELAAIFFSKKIIRSIKKVKDLKKFLTGIQTLNKNIQKTGLNQPTKDGKQRIESIQFKSIDGFFDPNRPEDQVKENIYNPHTRELIVYNLFQEQTKIKSNEKQIGKIYEAQTPGLTKKLSRLNIQVFLDEELDQTEKEKLENFLQLACLYPEKFSGVNISIDNKGLGEAIGWKQNNTHRRSTFRLSPKALDYFDMPMTDIDPNIDFSSYNGTSIQLEYQDINPDANANAEAIKNALFQYPIFTSIQKITYTSSEQYKTLRQNSDKDNKYFSRKGHELIINVDQIDPEQPLKGIKTIIGRSYWKALKQINQIVTSKTRVMEVHQHAGIKNAKLRNIEPIGQLSIQDKTVNVRYQLKDYQQNPIPTITEPGGTEYRGEFMINYSNTGKEITKTITLEAYPSTDKKIFDLTHGSDIDALNQICPSAALLVQRPELWMHLDAQIPTKT